MDAGEVSRWGKPKVICNVGNRLRQFNTKEDINQFLKKITPEDIKKKYYLCYSSWVAKTIDFSDQSNRLALQYHIDTLACRSEILGMIITSWPYPTKFKGYRHFKRGDVILAPNIPHKIYRLTPDRRVGRVLLY